LTIKVGDFTILYDEPYTCVRIEDEIAYLKKVSENKGRHLQMAVSLVPYFENNELIVPEPPKKERSITKLKIDISKLIREETGMPVSRDLVRFAHEHISDLIMQLAYLAERSALERGHKKLQPAHWYRLDLQYDEGVGFYDKSHNEYMED